MKNLANVSVIKQILSESGFKFSKSLGQNFLINEHVLNNMIENSCIDKNTNVIEIGPGFGTLTQRLCMNAKKVVSIEIDKSVIPILKNNLSDFDNLKIINADCMKTDLNEIIKEEFGGGKTVIAANLPYYITTPIIMNILETGVNIHSLTVMIQKEVAERIVAQPGTKSYGALSVAVSFYSIPEIIMTVPPSSFIPQPKVSSSVIKLGIRSEPYVKVRDEKMFFKIVRAAFSQRRKTLQNALANNPEIPADKEKIGNILNSMELDIKIRGESLTSEQFAALSDMLL